MTKALRGFVFNLYTKSDNKWTLHSRHRNRHDMATAVKALPLRTEFRVMLEKRLELLRSIYREPRPGLIWEEEEEEEA
jgi:hypothetical protein